MNIARAHLNTVILPDNSMLAVGGGVGPGPVDGNLYVGPGVPVRDPLAEHQHLDPGRHPGRGAHLPLHGAAPARRPGRLGRRRPARGHAAHRHGRALLAALPVQGRAPGGRLRARPRSPTARRSTSPSTTANVTKAVLIAPGADDARQRHEPALDGADPGPAAGGVTLTSPASGNVAPPGYYMLFLVNAQGVPSVAKSVKLNPAAPGARRRRPARPAARRLVHRRPGRAGWPARP